MKKEKYLSLFIEESKENLQALNYYLLELEKHPLSIHILDDIFRVAHTIKGMSAAMGYKDISSLTHEMETLLELLRSKQLTLNIETIDVLFLCLDNLELLIENISIDNPNPVDSTNLLYRLKKLTIISNDLSENIKSSVNELNNFSLIKSPNKIIDYTEEEKGQLQECINKSTGCFEIYVEFASDTVMKSVRAYMIINTLQNSSIRIIKTLPSNIEIINNQIQNSLTLIVTTDNNEKYIEELIYSISEIENVKISKINEYDLITPKNKLQDNNLNLNDNEISIINNGFIKGQKLILIGISLMPNTLMKNVRFLMVNNKLQETGTIVKTIPVIDDIESDSFNDYFEILLLTDLDIEFISKKISSISEINPDIRFTDITSELFNNINTQTINHNLNYSNLIESDSTKVINETDLTNDIVHKYDENYKHYKNHSTIRVDTDKLDEVLELINNIKYITDQTSNIDENTDIRYINDVIKSLSQKSLELFVASQDLKMIPIEQIFNRFSRMIRDISKKLNKEVNFIIESNNIDIDKFFIDGISESLIHILRNSLDHGIEMPDERIKINKSKIGTLKLSSYYEENNLFIVVEDDGSGIDIKKIRTKAFSQGLINEKNYSSLNDNDILNLIFISGFSTSDNATDISGRGFGMDAVKKSIEDMGGKIIIKTQKNIGSKFIIKLPKFKN